jgi:Zn-dependent protease
VGTSIRVATILGIPIGIHYSWIFVFLLLVTLLFWQFTAFPTDSVPVLQRWLTAILTTVLFFVSVLAHELSHSVVAVHKGIPVTGITLFIFGGVSQLAHEVRRPFTEFVVAIVGPLTSIVLGLLLLALWDLTRGLSDSLGFVLFSLALINLSLGIFNMLPGFPLDGGRVLRSVLWAITGSYWRATQIAARAGQGIGGVMVAVGIGFVFQDQHQMIWTSLVGVFLIVVATMSYRQEQTREALRAYHVSDAMTTDWCTLPGETPLTSQLVVQGFSRGQDFLGVLLEGSMQGIVSRRQLAQATRGEWANTSLAQVMRPLSDLTIVEPNQAIFDVLEHMDEADLERSTVVDNGIILGFITRSNAQQFVRSLRPAKLWL